jgi:hypothetical protein
LSANAEKQIELLLIGEFFGEQQIGKNYAAPERMAIRFNARSNQGFIKS